MRRRNQKCTKTYVMGDSVEKTLCDQTCGLECVVLKAKQWRAVVKTVKHLRISCNLENLWIIEATVSLSRLLWHMTLVTRY